MNYRTPAKQRVIAVRPAAKEKVQASRFTHCDPFRRGLAQSSDIFGIQVDRVDIICGNMKAIRFIPLTFLAGSQGFPLFVSYVLLLGAGLHLYRRFRV